MDDYLASRFAVWRMPPGTRNDALFAAFIEMPEAPAAMRRLAQNNLALAAQDAAIDGIMKDVGRYSATGLAMYLHTTGGLTLPRLKELCRQTGLISPGRARALLIYLRFLRYIAPSESNDRAALYVPTPRLMRGWQAMIRAVIDAATIIEPALGLFSNALAREDVLLSIIRYEGEMALFNANLGNKEIPFWHVFLNRYAGVQILHRLMLSAPDEAGFPPSGALPFSTSDLAREFHVSRPHVARLLKAAADAGLVAIDGNTLTLTEVAKVSVRQMMGMRLGSVIVAAALTHHEQFGGNASVPARASADRGPQAEEFAHPLS